MSRGEFLFPIEKENKGEQCRKWSHYLTKLFSCLCKLRLDEKRTHAHPSLSLIENVVFEKRLIVS